ncbi:hypothetical protein ACJVDH_08300 [Pedobacter sp. AW1-32]|uniref:hypothetical protein n=1 Tax=Pedobacter sp. AW1-32 TaxID=3383026 RepID=UPI003FF05D4E
MKRIIPYFFAAAISVIALRLSFSMADPELGISTAILAWIGCLWLVSGHSDRSSFLT